MSAATHGVSPESAKDERAADASLDKVRDILFGEQIRDYDSQLRRLDERIAKESRDIREEIRGRIANLESFVHHEIQTLTDRFKTEREERKEAITGVSTQLSEASRQADRKMNQMEDLTAQGDRELRQQLLDASNSLAEQLRRQHEELAHLVDKTAQELRHSKTDRTALAGFLTELAVRLQGASDSPQGDRAEHG